MKNSNILLIGLAFLITFVTFHTASAYVNVYYDDTPQYLGTEYNYGFHSDDWYTTDYYGHRYEPSRFITYANCPNGHCPSSFDTSYRAYTRNACTRCHPQDKYDRLANKVYYNTFKDYNDWRYESYGKDSGDVYYYDDYATEGVPASNWRFKEKYDPSMGTGNAYRSDYYYEPVYDEDLGYYNWRY